MNPLSTSDAPKLLQAKRVYIRDGVRKMQTDSGYMHMQSDTARRMFGKLKGGKYSKLQ